MPEDIGDSLLLWASDSKGEDGKDKRFVIIFGMKLIRGDDLGVSVQMREGMNFEAIGLDVIAAHEAGHVVLAHYYGRKVYGAYLQTRPLNLRDRGERSHVRYAPTPHIQEVHLNLGKLHERWSLAVRETLVTTRICLAGPIAQAIYQQKPYREMAGGQDYRDALSGLLLLERLRLSLPQPQHLDISYKHENILDSLANDILTLLTARDYSNYLQLIAQHLLAKQELSAQQISEMLEAMPRHQWHPE
ncbi:MAG: hypothetical protein P1U52_09580 [Porticoccaceae bacterium]|nr:hypothetical protein [Porticoccaceae bacterium]